MLAAKILEVDRAGGDSDSKVRKLLESLTQDDLKTIPGQWIQERGTALFWEDNLLDWALNRAEQ